MICSFSYLRWEIDLNLNFGSLRRYWENEAYHIDQLQENEVHCDHYMIARVLDRPDELVVAFEQVFDKLFFGDRTLQVFNVKQAVNKNDEFQKHWRSRTRAFASEKIPNSWWVNFEGKWLYELLAINHLRLFSYARIIHFCK